MTDKDLARLIELQEETVKLLVLIMKKGEPQAGAIHQLAAAGFGNKRIAEFLGTTANTVNVARQKAKRKNKKKKNAK